MLISLKSIAITVSLVIVSMCGIVSTSVYAATLDSSKQACLALDLATSTDATGDTTCSDPDSPDVNTTLKTAIDLFSVVVGFAALVMIIVGGLKYILSQGEGSNTASAKNTILYALIGLVIVALAQVIVRFVISRTK